MQNRCSALTGLLMPSSTVDGESSLETSTLSWDLAVFSAMVNLGVGLAGMRLSCVFFCRYIPIYVLVRVFSLVILGVGSGVGRPDKERSARV